MEKFLHLSWLVSIFTRKIYSFFYKQPSYQGSNVKNGLKFKQQLTKQPPTLKMSMQKFGRTLSKKFNFFNFKFKLNLFY